jgi:hypothetical protein
VFNELHNLHVVTCTQSLEVQLSGKPDPRLNRSLSISEFLKAFGKYKRVMTSVYPDRRAELDAYEDDIIGCGAGRWHQIQCHLMVNQN